MVKIKPKDRYDVERVGFGEPPRATSTAADFMERWASYNVLRDNDFETVASSDVPSTEGSTDCRYGRAVGFFPTTLMTRGTPN